MADSPNPPLPPADFIFLVESVLMQAQMQLGLVDFGTADDEDSQPDLASARHSIDLLGMLQEKTKGNLTIEEQRLIENGLTELRFRFVQIAHEMKGHQADLHQADPHQADLHQAGLQQPPSSGLSEPAAKEDSGPRIITPDGGKGSKTE